MKVYTTDKIRNVVLLGHSGCGKTSLVEAMAYLAGMTKRPGKPVDGNTISDFDKQEIAREISINTSIIPIPWDDCKVNILDTPGSLDFLGEVEEAASAADAAIIVVSGKSGVESGTKRAWKLCEKYNLPRMIFVTEMDVDDASFRQVVEDLQELYGKKIAPFHLPIRRDGQFVGYVNVIQQRAKAWKEDGTVEPCEVPDYSMENLELCREALMESIAETSEEFMDRYFGGEEFSEDEIRQTLRQNVSEGSIVPVLMGSNILCRGMFTMMVDVIKYLPSPEGRACSGINAKSNEPFEANYDFSKSKSAYVFKTIVDPFVGKYSLIKVASGVLKTDDVLYNQNQDAEEKIGKLYILTGSKAEEVKELHAGDIGALSKLNKVATTDTLSTKAHPIVYIRTTLPTPYTY
ncbi:MAG: GTP-binding protein, partial [Lachnospiraceae bacterium]|nr:GTP-binding protein [Lachnospiraceae bacterium]